MFFLLLAVDLSFVCCTYNRSTVKFDACDDDDDLGEAGLTVTSSN